MTVARSITDPDEQAQALAAVAGALARTGQHEQAATMARSITDPYWRARALAAVAGSLAMTGQHQQAVTVAHSITSPDQQAQALAAIAGALARAGQHEQATTTARSITDPERQAQALAAPGDPGPVDQPGHRAGVPVPGGPLPGGERGQEPGPRRRGGRVAQPGADHVQRLTGIGRGCRAHLVTSSPGRVAAAGVGVVPWRAGF
jgi:hypothetical protein